jgi:HK97 family phage prohead protease
MPSEVFEYKTTSLGTFESKSGAIINLDEAQGVVECFVAGIGNKDSVGDIVTTGAFTKSLMRRKPRVVWGHNWNDPIGKVLEIYEVPPTDRRLPMKMKMAGIGGLFARVQFNLQSEKGKEAFANVAFFGEEQEWSIGYKTLRAQFDQKSQANVIFELELYEVSPVLHGANQLTGTISVKSEEMPTATPSSMSMDDDDVDFEEMAKQLSQMIGAKVSLMGVSEDEITFARQSDGTTKKFKCNFGRSGGQFMFGPPRPIVVVAKPTAMPMGSPGMTTNIPMGMPQNEPRRIVRPSQMPSMPIAVKPGQNGMAMIPLPRVEYENSQSPKFDPTNLDEEESDLRDALLKIVKRHGRFNEDEDGVWAGYKPAYQNPVASIGVKCANCVFYQGEGKCKIIAMEVEPEGKCRFAVIPKGVVGGDVVAKKTAEFSSDIDEENYLSDLQVKYPGELLVAALRGAIGRKRRKRRKYKDLSEFGIESQDVEEKSYCLPVWPQHAFEVKQLLDPIFDYYMAETVVEPDGIVIKSGVSYEMIEAIDNALESLKKKSLADGETEIKAVGYRLGRAIGSRLIDKPNIGGGRSAQRFFTSRGAEDFNPFTARDRNLNGIVGEGLFLRGQPLAQPDPTPDGPGSIRNPKPSSEQLKKKPGSEEKKPLKAPRGGQTSKPALEKQSKKNPKTSSKVSSGYSNYLKNPTDKRSGEDRFKYDGPFHMFKDNERLSSGKVKDSDNVTPEEQKEILDAAYVKMTEQIISALTDIENKKASSQWQIPWRQLSSHARNATGTERAYQGTNQLMLLLVASARGYKTGKWAGAAQWKKLGGKINKKNQDKGVQILAPNRTMSPIMNADGDVIGSYKGYHVTTVWNVQDVDGLPAEMYEDKDVMLLSPEERLKDLENIIEELGPKWEEKAGSGAFYTPSTDKITMPRFEQFNNPIGFYSTLFHETVHWTGNPSRLDRKVNFDRNSSEYAFEELIAEIGSAFALGSMGIEAPLREDHAPYVAGWLKALKDKPDSLKLAIAGAQQAVDYLMNKSATMRKKAGIPDAERKGKEDVTMEVPMIVGFEDSPQIPSTSGIEGAFGDADVEDLQPLESVKKPKGKKKKTEELTEKLSSGSKIGGGNTFEEDMLSGDYVRRSNKDGLVFDVAGRLSSGADRGEIPHTSGDSKKGIKRSPGTSHFGETYGLSFEPTEQQRDIIDAGVNSMLAGSPGVITVSAGAGSGKTTTLKALMAAAEREFDTSRFVGRPEALEAKLNFISQKYSTPEDTFDLAKMTPETRDKKLAELRKKFPAPIAYYVVFNKKNEEEAASEFTDNTGVATVNKLSWWSLRLGQGDETYGKGFRRKIEISIQDRGKFKYRNPDGSLKVIKFKKIDGTDGETLGFTPGWKELGYIKLSSPDGWIQALKLNERPEFAAGGKGTANPGVTGGGAPVTATIGTRDYADILNKALTSFANSADDKIGPQHFQRSDISKSRDSESIVDSEWASIPDQWVKDAQDGWDMVTDANTTVLPNQGQTDKLWALTNPDLRTDPGMVGFAEGKDTEDVQIDKKYNVGDILPDGRMVIRVTEGQKGNKRRAKVSTVYASKDKPLSVFMIDEAQDMNPVMEKVLMDNRERLPILLVGDKRQAVYAFRGAKDILSSIDSDYDLTLNESFRYGPAVAWVANLIQAQGNIDDALIGKQDRFHHVAGLAEEIIKHDFDFSGLSAERTKQALSKIESKHKKDRLVLAKEPVREDFSMAGLSLDEKKAKLTEIDKKYKTKLSQLTDEEIFTGIEIQKALSKELLKIEDAYTPLSSMKKEELDEELKNLKENLIKRAQGEIVANMTDADAILTRENATIIYEALRFIENFEPRFTRNGQPIPPTVMIPATKHREMKAFFNHLSFIMDLKPETQAQRTKNGLRPPASSYIGDVWNLEELKRKVKQDQYGQLKSMFNLVVRGNKALSIPPRRAWEYRDMFAEGVTPGSSAPVIVPERKMLKLSKLRDITKEDLIEISKRSGTNFTSNTANSRAVRNVIIPDTSGKSKLNVNWHLQLDGADRSGQWTGAVEIIGAGINGGGEYTNTKTGKQELAPQGAYFRDIAAILEDRDYYGGKVVFKKNGQTLTTKSAIPSMDLFEIKGDTPEETAFILNDIIARMRDSAKTPNADVEITTAQLAKGREWDSVRLANDFKKPEDLGVDPNTGKPRFSVSRQEELNLVYVALTRAKRRLDPGAEIHGLYLSGEASAETERAINEAIKDGKMPANLSKPTNFRNPYDGKSDDDKDPVSPVSSTGEEDDVDVPDDYQPVGDGKSEADLIKDEQEAQEGEEESFDNPDDAEDTEDAEDLDNSSMRLSSGAITGEQTGGRVSRRVSGARKTRTKERPENPSPRLIAGIRLMGNPNESREYARALDFSMKVWDGFRKTGIALDVDTQTLSSVEREKEIRSALSKVSQRIGQKKNINVGNVANNNSNKSPSASTWMLSADKLRDTLRMPTEFVSVKNQRGEPDVSWTQSRPISIEELGSLLSLDEQNKRKLSEPGAGLSHDAVRTLIGEIGREPAFSGWELFSPLSRKTPGVTEMTPEERITESAGRANMRDRFIIETFGKEAFPFWFDPEENNTITPEAYDSLGEVSARSKFRAIGQFDERDPFAGDSDVEVDFYSEGLDAAELSKIDPEIEKTNVSADKTSRKDFELSKLLNYLGISRQEWVSSISDRLRESFKTDNIGLAEGTSSRSWENSGVPIAYISEMIKTGLIPNAAEVWGEGTGPGAKLDTELSMKKYVVYEALFDFMNKSNISDNPVNRALRESIAGKGSEATVRKASSLKGSKFSPAKGDEPRFSTNEVQNIVNRFNERFNTSYTIEDIFSDEQLRAARDRIEQQGTSVSMSSRNK